ncbi:MAG: heterodisulfide reductase-related iron-sulfur binding cluster [Pyrinomonadaceae bacterium]
MSYQQTQLATMLAAEEDKLLACVHCGLCLEACPTYIKTGDENDSPRGRIYLMRAVEEERLAADSKTFERHINRCLGCRACEQACPAGVQYGQLLEAARSDLSQSGAKRSLTSRTLRFVLRHVWLHPARLRFAFALARIMRDAKLARLLLRSRLPRLISRRAEFALLLLESSAPVKLSDERKKSQEATTLARESVSKHERVAERALLFNGCVTEGLFARVNRATARVLEANGCETSTPTAQVCCGALHAHAGDLEGARILARRNLEAFAETDAPIVTNAGGCGAMLASYAHLLADEEEYADRARRFSARVRDISQQLALTGIRQGAEIQDAVVTYDASCHLLYGQRAVEEPLQMLRAIPGIRFVPLEASEMCCGGAGVYNLVEMELSACVLDEKLPHIRETGASVLATGNPGCHMQIGAGARLAGIDLKICHPVELLDEAYGRGDRQ